MTTALELAIIAIRSGRREEGRQLLNLLIQENPNNEMAWLWMSSVVNNDEQRARCLYHVLAIDPNNVVARKGLEVLGIVVSDSRPVKVPRDSQPIKIPVARPRPQAGPPKALPAPRSPLARASERRPFRLDPQEIVDELPFTPVKPPFSKPVSPARSAPTTGLPPNGGQQPSSKPIPVQPHSADTTTIQPGNVPQNNVSAQPFEPAPVVQPSPVAAASPPPEPMPVRQQPVATVTPPSQINGTQMSHNDPTQNAAPQQTSPSDTDRLPAPPTPVPNAPDSLPFNTQPAPTGPTPDTRPTQPFVAPQANTTMGAPPMAVNNPQPYPAPGPHANITMGMPTQNFAAQPAPQPALHAQPTLGAPAYPQMQNGQLPHPSEPAPVVHSNTTMGMPLPGYLQAPQPLAQAPVMASSAAMVMPTYQNMVDFRPATSAPAATNQKHKQQQSEEEGINVLAVIIFGSLSVTALGGLGMLILLMFTTG